jgi:hypothetical protein
LNPWDTFGVKYACTLQIEALLSKINPVVIDNTKYTAGLVSVMIYYRLLEAVVLL